MDEWFGGATNRSFSRWRHLTTTTRTHFSFSRIPIFFRHYPEYHFLSQPHPCLNFDTSCFSETNQIPYPFNVHPNLALYFGQIPDRGNNPSRPSYLKFGCFLFSFHPSSLVSLGYRQRQLEYLQSHPLPMQLYLLKTIFDKSRYNGAKLLVVSRFSPI